MEQGGSYILTLAEELGPWAWLIGGIVLLALELAIPGSFLIWLGLAAVVVGLVSFAVDLSWQAAWIGLRFWHSYCCCWAGAGFPLSAPNPTGLISMNADRP